MSKLATMLIGFHLLLIGAVLVVLLVTRSVTACESAQARAAMAWQAVALAEIAGSVRGATDPAGASGVDLAYGQSLTTTNAVEVATAHAAGDARLASKRVEQLPWSSEHDPDTLGARMEEVYRDAPRRVDLARRATERALAACK